MTKSIYILSLPHSGSTLLEMLLSKHDNVISLGEVTNTLKVIRSDINKEKRQVCSYCNTNMYECSFWKNIVNDIQLCSDLPSAYSIVRSRVDILFKEGNNNGQDNQFYMVDSSKRLKDLMRFYIDNKEISDPKDVKVLFLIRDFRGWVNSVEAEYKKHKDNDVYNHKKYRFGLIVNSYLWLGSYLMRLFILHKNKIQFTTVSYEKLVFDMDKELSSIFDFLDIDSSKFKDTNTSLSHNVNGNTMRLKFNSDNKIKYKYQHMYDIRYILYFIFILPVYILNSIIFKNK